MADRPKVAAEIAAFLHKSPGVDPTVVLAEWPDVSEEEFNRAIELVQEMHLLEGADHAKTAAAIKAELARRSEKRR